MKVCYLNFDGAPTIRAATHNRVGGLNTILFNLLRTTSRFPGFQALVVYRHDGGEIPPELATLPVVVNRIAAGEPKQLQRNQLDDCLPEFVDGVETYLRKNTPDLVHTSGSEAGITMFRLRRRYLPIPWVHTSYATLSVRRVNVDGMKVPDALAGEVCQRELLCFQDCDQVIALSNTDKMEIAQVFGTPLGKIIVAEPGVDHDIFQPRVAGVRPPTVVSAGRMTRIKDFPFLIAAFKVVVDNNKHLINLRLVVVGGNKQERENIGLPELTNRLGLTDRVDFVDGRSQIELADYFRNARVFVGSSRHETFGLLPIEACACGTPFVVRSNSGYLETAVDGFGGYLSDNDSVTEMAGKIGKILNLSRDDWERLSSQAADSSKKYQWSRTAAICLETYRQLLESYQLVH